MGRQSSFRYFAYGSNLWLPQMRSRCPSARTITTATLHGWSTTYDKPSADGSAKLNIRPDPDDSVVGVVYEIEDGERRELDVAEPGYTPTEVRVAGSSALTYTYEGEPYQVRPYDWYVEMAKLGAATQGIGDGHLQNMSLPDPLAPGLRPATLDDTALIQSILSAGLGVRTTRYYAHPGEYAWWIYHDDPRHPDHLSTWIQDDTGFVTLDSLRPGEINVFTRPGHDRVPLIEWSQRRLDGMGDVGWVSDADHQIVAYLQRTGYEPFWTSHSYRRDLLGELPVPDLPEGWHLRPVRGEDEANARRAASHAAFQSTMPAAMHLQRYLMFMRSPAYVPERDLVAIAPDGAIASFMVWWSDDSGVAQIEPFGTQPEYQRRGIGRALIHHGLHEMKASGMHTCRVMTDEPGPATAFYESVGFEVNGPVRWWRRTGS